MLSAASTFFKEPLFKTEGISVLSRVRMPPSVAVTSICLAAGHALTVGILVHAARVLTTKK